MARPRLPARIDIREVGPRDGLQVEAPVAPAERVVLIDALVAAGLRRVEAAAFVSPRAVPAMAGADEVFDRLRRRGEVSYAALVPNRRGAQLALDAGADVLTVTISASEAYSERNVRMSVGESLDQVAAIVELADGVPVDAVVSCAFGSPYEGDIDPGVVGALVDRLRASEVASVTLADTTGMATPRRITDAVEVVGSSIGLHLHDTRGTALVNAYAAMAEGVVRFDASVGGLGGSPFAPGAGGNLATEDLVHLCDDLGVETGIDLDALLDAVAHVAELVGHPVPGKVAAAGPRSRRAP